MKIPVQTKKAAPSMTGVRQGPPAHEMAAMPEQEESVHDIPTQMEHATQFGHSLGNISVGSSTTTNGGKGLPLPGTLRQKMEHAFGANFSNVRIHEGSHVESIGADAFTQGTDIHFAPGKYQPLSEGGQALLGHELTHVVQQRLGRVAVPQGNAIPINQDSHHEDEADEVGAIAAQGKSVTVQGASSEMGALQKGDVGGAQVIQKNGKGKKGKDKASKEARREARANAGTNTVFNNDEGRLPKARRNQHYEEFDVGQGPQNRGRRRGVQLVETSTGRVLSQHHTDDHYENFTRID